MYVEKGPEVYNSTLRAFARRAFTYYYGLQEVSPIKLYEIFNPELKMNVRYRVLMPDEVDMLILEFGSESRDQFMQAVLESVIHNLRTEVTAALRKMPKEDGKNIINSLFNGALMLNPGLDIDSWLQICSSPQLLSASAGKVRAVHPPALPTSDPVSARKRRVGRQKFLNLEKHLKSRVVGQDEAIEELVLALKRAQVGLADERRPLGVFLLAGASGTGKSYLAKELHNYLYGDSYDLIRVDCGEYQHKHENQKLLGSPNGYLGYDEGGQLTNSIIKHPNTVVLLDEVEKAHPDIWNTFLRVFDEGILTSGNGKEANFRNAIIIMTTNLGNSDVVKDITERRTGFGENNNDMPKRDRVIRLANEAIRKNFRPELLNRIDKTVVFNHLTDDNYLDIAELELGFIQSKLEKRGLSLSFDKSQVLPVMVRDGTNHVQGARGLAQLRRDRIENLLADLMLGGRCPRGSIFNLSYEADDYRVSVQRPASKSAQAKPVLLSDSISG